MHWLMPGAQLHIRLSLLVMIHAEYKLSCLQMATKEEDLALSDFTPLDFEGGHETSYIFVRSLGSGAFAEANLYRKIEDNSLVVWKEINMARLGDKEKRDAVNEIDILSLLNHANIITYYNHFLDGETLLIELEYANGGSLAQKIDKQNELFEEEVVKWYLFQLASALAHCHEHGIIHRDVKCLNIFMTKTDLLKLGDFGISKVLESTSEMAETVAGTPLYMSPEIMQGAKYDYKTDMWALGCVLYELLTLTRTFQGTNHLRLAYEIVCGQHGSVDSRYSKGIRDLVDSLLQKDPADRPTAQAVIDSDVLNNRSIIEKRVYELNTGARRARIQTSVSVTEQTVVPVVKSKVTEVFQWGGGKIVPQKQDIFVKGRSPAQVSAGHSHFAVVTMEKEVYTWANLQGGDKIVGQLGHGNTAAYKTPKKVEAFEGVGIIQADCGEDFTICVSDEGQVYSFGSDFYGCLGCENEEGDEVTSPVCINLFGSCPVQEVSCGDNHVVALTKDGDVYTWGCGEFGRLGLGSEDDFASPQKVDFKKRHLIKHVFAGADGTMLLTTTGRVLASGSNEHNKLGFNSETSGLKKHKPKVYDIPCKVNFTLVRPLMRLNVVSIATGASHSAVIDVCCHLYTFGCNKFGQLGVGDFKNHSGICRVPGVLVNHRVEKVTCGDGFTVASTSDNYVYAWGNGENGRLGTGQMDLGKGPNNKSVSIPRPIFGALHIVPHLSARHWHTILIAEKVLNQKTLRSRGSMPKMKLHSGTFISHLFGFLFVFSFCKMYVILSQEFFIMFSNVLFSFLHTEFFLD
ncbi:serine/threonine-protein kinase Nek9-like isoform X2 [Mercenaria mercenaria]|uniref:serine/threonine-protein kinase Nek9-like isoform X2 n=1 Tax=Mercenaria mercenaria TaxID=6596 RepID=UPI00234F11A0|nr:serine/threonine-protein kinase Nek9-like isoform X2 [Mercenaria mercenaria]